MGLHPEDRTGLALRRQREGGLSMKTSYNAKNSGRRPLKRREGRHAGIHAWGKELKLWAVSSGIDTRNLLKQGGARQYTPVGDDHEAQDLEWVVGRSETAAKVLYI
jgi:hypothetical protein